jgi:hypothetical protein
MTISDLPSIVALGEDSSRQFKVDGQRSILQIIEKVAFLLQLFIADQLSSWSCQERR